MTMGCDRRIVIVHEEEVGEIVASDGIEGMPFRMVELAFAADLVCFLVPVMHNGDFATERVINVITSGRKRDGFGFAGFRQPKSECGYKIPVKVKAGNFGYFLRSAFIGHGKGAGQF
ncbi:hypothetical protein AD940_07005 [Gluconobacter thailandicus]|nr:hypothetical protein AD940_07005 [Gluconobacter thailandicus]